MNDTERKEALEITLNLSADYESKLAAEREECAIVSRSRDAWKYQVAGLAKQLSDGREKVKTLVDALKLSEALIKSLAGSLDGQWHNNPLAWEACKDKGWLTDALAKVGTYPLPDGRTQ